MRTIKNSSNFPNHEAEYQGIIPAPNNLLPKFVVGSILLHLVTVVILGFFAVVLYRLAIRPSPTLVQTSSGGALTVNQAESSYRDPTLIKDFVGQTAQTLYSWSPKINGELDPGVVIDKDSELLVTTPSWEAGFSLTEKKGYRTSFLTQLARFQGKLPIKIWGGQGNTFLKINHIGEPETIQKGEWKVDLLAYLLLFDRGQLIGQAIPFNKTFYVKAIDNPPLLLKDSATPIQKAIWNSRSAQLEIQAITDFEDD